MSYYECKRCGHITKQKIEMSRHINRKNKCSRNINSYNYQDSELEKMSLIKHSTNKTIECEVKNNDNNDNNNENINNKCISINDIIDNKINQNNIIKNDFENANNFDQKYSNIKNIENDKYIIKKNNINNLKNKLNKNIENKQTNNKFTCDICLKIFTRKYNLDRHKIKCCSDKIDNNYKLDSNNSSNTNNTTNNFNTINNNYNKNLFVNFNVEPFDNDWDVSRITKFTRHSILLSKIMYSNLLDNILQNEKNLNVVIQKDTNTGIVYKNNVDKFITMNMQDIIDKSMEKLNKHLKDFYTESLKDDEFVIMDKIFQEQIINIENKYNEFKNNDEIKKKVEEFITQIYDKKKENALKLYNNTLLKNNNDNGY